MAALGARRGVSAGLFRIEVVATDAVEGDLAALLVVEGSVAAVVIEPEDTKHTQYRQGVKHDFEDKIRRRDHSRKFA